jgi:hypothetical protein
MALIGLITQRSLVQIQPPLSVTTAVIPMRLRRARPLCTAVIVLALGVATFVHPAAAVTQDQLGRPAATRVPGHLFTSVASFTGEGELAVVSQGKLWVLDGANGSVAEVPVLGGQVPSSPSFSSDGRWISFITTRQTATGMTRGVWVARSDGLGAHLLATFSGPSTLVIGWDPGHDVLAYVTATSHDIYAPPSEVWLWAPGTSAHVVARAPEVTGGPWSPDGTSLAVMSDTDIPRTVLHWDATITTYRLSGGAGRVWLKLSVTAAAPTGNISSVPEAGGLRDVAYVVPMGWWPRWGIGYAVIQGNPGSPFDSSVRNNGLLLETIGGPGAHSHVLGNVLVDGADGPIAASAGGQLAITVNSFAEPIWQHQQAERCSPVTFRCVPLPEPAGTVSMDALWSPDGAKLSFVVGQPSTASGFDQAQVEGWYNALALEVYDAGTGTVHRLAQGTGAVVPLWSANSKDLLFVRDDGIWIWRGLMGADLSPLVGTEVRQVRLDYQVTLLLVDGPYNQERASGLLQIETPFHLEADGQTWTVAPSDKSTYAPVCHLVHLTVVSAEMDDERLRLRFSDGSALTVERDPRYESWSLTGSGVPEVLVTPP